MRYRTTPVLFVLLLLVGGLTSAEAQERQRPYPNPIDPPPRWEAALQAETRTETGAPGSNYWTNEAAYDIEATLSPETRMVRGSETITYHNQSPDTLQQLVVHLRQNIYKDGSARRTALSTPGGMKLSKVLVDGERLIEGTEEPTGYEIENTVMRIRPPASVAPGDTVTLDLSWSYKLRRHGRGPREGTDGEVYYLGYWYPQMAVYDDVQGWDTDPFLQHAEFYMGYAEYDVEITVPQGWLVGATGTLQNPSAVLPSSVRRRLERAAQTREVVSVVDSSQRGPGSATTTSPTGKLTWHFRADNVRDVAIGTSDQYVWDATSAQTADGDSTLIHAFYRPDREAWHRGAEFGQFSIEYLSDRVHPYPYPHMRLFEGVVGGGMEYPMMTIISGGGRTEKSLHGTTLHEIAHQWFPMLVGSEETDHIWMDEGLVTYYTREGRLDFWDNVEPWAPTSGYFRRAGTARETPPMRHGDLFPSVGALVTASYDKTSRMLRALEGIVGRDALDEALQTYTERWRYKHPYPYDLFNTVEDVAGRELDWLWRSFLDTTWTLDQAVTDVTSSQEGITVTVRDHGDLPLPVFLRATYADGSTERTTISVDTWLEGNREATATLPPGSVIRVEIDPQMYFPDLDRSNNTWTADSTDG